MKIINLLEDNTEDTKLIKEIFYPLTCNSCLLVHEENVNYPNWDIVVFNHKNISIVNKEFCDEWVEETNILNNETTEISIEDLNKSKRMIKYLLDSNLLDSNYKFNFS